MDEARHTAASPGESGNHGPGRGVPNTDVRAGETLQSAKTRVWEPSEGYSYREPPIVRYLGLLWERRWLVLGGAFLPALLVAGLLSLSPRRYTTTFVYERPLAEIEYGVFLRRFYSQENLDKIADRLREQGLTQYVQRLEQARTEQSFEQLIRFEVAPMYPKRLQTTDPCTSEKISAFKAKLLSIQIFGNSAQEVAAVAGVVIGNIENVLPIYDIRNHMKESLHKLRGDAAKIEEDRFKLSIDLQREAAKLEQLKGLEGTDTASPQDSVTLQFDGSERSRDFLAWLSSTRIAPSRIADLQETLRNVQKYNFYDFLPLSYQVRAVQSKMVDLQETLASDTEKHNFYLQVLDLNHRLLAKIEESLLTYYTAQEYLAFLGEQLRACKEPALANHLNSYIRTTENLVLVNTRAGEKPVVHPMAKGALKTGGLVFILLLMLVMFLVVLLEHRRQRHRPMAATAGAGLDADPQGVF